VRPLPPARRGRRPLGRLALLLAALAACTSAEERFAAHVERGERYAREGQRAQAILEYGSALEVDPASAEIHERLADLLIQQGARGSAAQHYREAHALDPGRVEAAMKEVPLIAGSDRARADALVAEALARSPEKPIVHRTVSELALLDGRAADAEAAARRALELGPQDPESWLQLGRAGQGLIRADQERRRTTEPRVFADAVAAFERADALRGGDVGARLERARVLQSWPGHVQEARDGFLSALELVRAQGDPALHAIVAHRVDDFGRATGDAPLRAVALDEAVRAKPDDLDAWRALVDLYQGRDAGIAAVFARLLAALPEDPRAHQLYASHLLARGRSRECIAHLEQALGDGVEAPALWELLVQARLRQGQLLQAQRAQAELAKAFPDSPLPRRAQARLALAEGREEEAAATLRELAASEPSAEAQRLLALAEERLRNYDEALAAVDRALALSGGSDAAALRQKARIACRAEYWAPCLRTARELVRRGERLTPAERLVQAHALYEIRRPGAGRAELEKLLREPEWPLLAAVAFARREGQAEPERARGFLEAARARQPRSAAVLRARVELELATGRSDEALALLDSAVRETGGSPTALLLRARVLMERKEYDRAENDALRAFEAAPAIPGGIDLLLAVYAAQGRLAEARRSFEEAEAAGVLHPGARLLLGRLYAQGGDLARARACFEKALGEAPRLAVAKVELALLLAREGAELERAVALAREAAVQAQGSRAASHALGYAQLRSGQNREALRELRRALSLQPAPGSQLEPTLRYHLALAFQALERNEQAARSLQAALALDPAFPDADDARRRLRELGEPGTGEQAGPDDARA
jgi:tetratricopeptide (TPR) repeat protein